MKTQLFKIAHSIKGQYVNFAAALTAAWKVMKLRLQMKKGIVHFAFTKVDGSIRKAIGTLNNVPVSKGVKDPNYSIFIYFDVEANDYRSARIQNIIF